MSFLKPRDPLIGIAGGSAYSKAGLFYRKSVALDTVDRIVALKRDRLTLEEVFVAFIVAGKITFWVSECDRGYKEFLAALPEHFRGIRDINDMKHGEVFEAVDFELWRRGA